MKTLTIKKLENPCTNDYLDFKKYIHSDMMAWYYNGKTSETATEEDIPFYGHILMERPNKELGTPYSQVVSPHFDKANTILKQIFSHNKMDVWVIYRLNLNATFYIPTKIKKSIYHKDLEIPHQNLIIYMSKFDGGQLYIKNGSKEMEFLPQEDEIILFSGSLPHCIGLPQGKKRRIIMVANIYENTEQMG